MSVEENMNTGKIDSSISITGSKLGSIKFELGSNSPQNVPQEERTAQTFIKKIVSWILIIRDLKKIK